MISWVETLSRLPCLSCDGNNSTLKVSNYHLEGKARFRKGPHRTIFLFLFFFIPATSLDDGGRGGNESWLLKPLSVLPSSSSPPTCRLQPSPKSIYWNWGSLLRFRFKRSDPTRLLFLCLEKCKGESYYLWWIPFLVILFILPLMSSVSSLLLTYVILHYHLSVSTCQAQSLSSLSSVCVSGYDYDYDPCFTSLYTQMGHSRGPCQLKLNIRWNRRQSIFIHPRILLSVSLSLSEWSIL